MKNEDYKLHAEIISNLLYIIVGFSLILGILEKIESIATVQNFLETLALYGILVIVSVKFIFYINRTEDRTQYMVIAGYIFVFAISIPLCIIAKNIDPVVTFPALLGDVHLISLCIILILICMVLAMTQKIKNIVLALKNISGLVYSEEYHQQRNDIEILSLIFYFAIMVIMPENTGMITMIFVIMALIVFMSYWFLRKRYSKSR
jgi:hypothetical protein